MRKQDVKLLKQLVNISDVIQALNQKWKEAAEINDSFDIEYIDGRRSTSDLFSKRKRAPLVRQQSLPRYYNENVVYAQSSFNSSIEGNSILLQYV